MSRPPETPTIVRHASVREFLDRASDYLGERETEHNLLLGVALALRDREPDDAQVWLTVEQNAAVVGAVMRTPPHRPALSRMPADAASAVAGHFRTIGPPVSGVFGPAEEVRQFSDDYCEPGLHQTRLKLRLWLYRCDSPPPAPTVEVTLRSAVRGDQDQVRELLAGFHRDEVSPPPEDLQAEAGRVIERGAVVAVDNADQPVCLAAIARRSPTGVVVAPVFTVTEQRRRGLASACVAELTRRQFDQGVSFCCLFANQQNETANSVYQKLGYSRVCEFEWWEFDDV
ncbi:MAG: GNAT family N-acetyltransferase [Planctomycetaceae bacterium]|nr:GNAT family N-acetyltransferase [Planctomycetaceae bacterium]